MSTNKSSSVSAKVSADSVRNFIKELVKEEYLTEDNNIESMKNFANASLRCDLGLDSLDCASLVIALEEKYGVYMDYCIEETDITVDDLVNKVLASYNG